MGWNGPFNSLFSRFFATLAAVVVLFFAAAHLFSVPLVRETVQASEEAAGRTILENVYQTVNRTKIDLDSFREVIIQARKKELQDIVQLAEANLRGHLSHEDGLNAALEVIFEELRHLVYGRQDYLWVMDDDGRILSHPDARLHKGDFAGLKDVHGNLVLAPLIELGQKHGGGFHSYWWRRLGQDEPTEKLSYCKNLVDLGFHLCTGVYLDDVEDTVAKRRQELFGRLQEELRGIRLARGGYVFVFDHDLNMLIHPDVHLEGRHFGDRIDPLSGRPLAMQLKQMADQPQGLRYRWDRPEDPGNYSYDKLAWVRYFPAFDWYLASSVYLDDLYAESVQLGHRLWGIAVVGMALAMVLGFLVVRRMTDPLEKLSATARRVENGDLTARCPVVHQDEIGLVANAFNAMVAELQGHIANLDDKVRQRTMELEQANAELRELDRLKSEFLSNISHELRTPLTAILGFAKILKGRLEKLSVAVTDPKAQKEWIKARENSGVILQEGERLTRLVDQVLDLTQLEAGKVALARESVAMAILLQEEVARFQARATAQGIDLMLHLPPALPTLEGDGARLRQVVDHLLDNALKFTSQGTIAVTVEAGATWLEVGVQDSGQGVPASLREKIFDKFHQVGDVLVDKPSGIGLGLPISRLIVERHGGSMGMTPVAGGGSRFFFRLPVQCGVQGTEFLDTPILTFSGLRPGPHQGSALDPPGGLSPPGPRNG